MLEKIAYFAAGAVTGGLGVYFVLARKFEQDFQEATIEINKELAEIAEAKGHQEHVELTYYMEDDVFADNRGVPMQDTSWFDNIISGISASDSIIYVRSMSRHADFEITILDDSYEHSVLGVEYYEDE